MNNLVKSGVHRLAKPVSRLEKKIIKSYTAKNNPIKLFRECVAQLFGSLISLLFEEKRRAKALLILACLSFGSTKKIYHSLKF